MSREARRIYNPMKLRLGALALAALLLASTAAAVLAAGMGVSPLISAGVIFSGEVVFGDGDIPSDC